MEEAVVWQRCCCCLIGLRFNMSILVESVMFYINNAL